ncbi:FxsA family protein [Roseobacter sp. HKCCA0434]|uniref:FxsA family protein n=1 Tax=Roseobacter sp. HKCCA0434 TaxID=3079297 RepID=UPI002905B839|nr:FxsA family protein [Roseobacter sp. HKCCA0434]
MYIFLALLIVPIIEIALFIQVGGLIGLWPTLLTVILTAIAGTWLLRSQGGDALRRLQNILREGGDPRGPLAHGALILVAGIVLLTPGFFTDAIGFALLIPAVRGVVIRELAKRVRVVGTSQPRDAGRGARPANEAVIDGEYEVELPPEGAPRGNSGWTRPRE